MVNEELTPSESEWMIMEVLWESEEVLTSSEIIKRLNVDKSMTSKMARVLLNRLCKKKMIGYTIDKKDSRVYHYFSIRTREECLKEKSSRFVNSYFLGNQTNAYIALLENVTLTEGQIQKLEEIIKKSREI